MTRSTTSTVPGGSAQWVSGITDFRVGAIPSLKSIAAWGGMAYFWLVFLLSISEMTSRAFGYGAAPRWLFMGLAVAGVLLAGISLGAGTRRLHTLLAFATGLLVALPVLRGLITGQVVFSVMGTFAVAATALVLAAVHVPPPWLRWSVLGAVTSVVLLSIGAALLTRTGVEVEALYYRNTRTLLGFPQLGGLAGHPNGMGIYAAFALTLQAQVLRNHWRALSRWWLAGFIVFGPLTSGLALIWTQSRGGQWTGLAGLVIVLLPTAGRRGRIWAWGGLGTLFLLSFLPWFLAVIRGASFNGRVIAWEAAWSEFWSHPILGYGPDVFRPKPYWAENPGSLWEPLHAHQEFLQVAAMSGIVGVTALVVVTAIAMFVAVHARSFDGRWALGVVAVMIAGSALEVSLGVSSVVATYVPGFLALAVVASSMVLWRNGAEDGQPQESTQTDRSGGPDEE